MRAPPRDETLRLLAEGDLEILGYLPRASNETFLARVTAGSSMALAVYKPRDGETPLWDFPEGTLYRREVAAFVVAEALGWPAVPPTVERDGPDGPGSLQLFVEFDPAQHYLSLRDRRPDDFREVAAFDVVVNNADRKSGHCLLGADGRVFCIDHGVCFHPDAKLRTVIWEFAGEPVPPHVLERLESLAVEARGGALGDRLASLLAPEEVRAIAARAEALFAAGRFPHPGPGRPYPWPLV